MQTAFLRQLIRLRSGRISCVSSRDASFNDAVVHSFQVIVQNCGALGKACPSLIEAPRISSAVASTVDEDEYQRIADQLRALCARRPPNLASRMIITAYACAMALRQYSDRTTPTTSAVTTPPDQVIDAARCILLQVALLEVMPLPARAQQLSEDKPLHNARLSPFMLRFFANANACFGKMQTRDHFMADVFDGRLFCALLARGSACFAQTATSQLADNTYDVLCRVVLGDLCQVPTPRQTAPVIRATPGKKMPSLTVIQSEVATVRASCVTIHCALYCAHLVPRALIRLVLHSSTCCLLPTIG